MLRRAGAAILATSFPCKGERNDDARQKAVVPEIETGLHFDAPRYVSQFEPGVLGLLLTLGQLPTPAEAEGAY